MFPMASSFSVQIDKEMTAFIGETHVDNLAEYYKLVRARLLEPGWREDDFTRLKDDAINAHQGRPARQQRRGTREGSPLRRHLRRQRLRPLQVRNGHARSKSSRSTM